MTARLSVGTKLKYFVLADFHTIQRLNENNEPAKHFGEIVVSDYDDYQQAYRECNKIKLVPNEALKEIARSIEVHPAFYGINSGDPVFYSLHVRSVPTLKE
jgi:hypothetical protein